MPIDDNEEAREHEEQFFVAEVPPPFSHVRFALLNVFLLFLFYGLAGALFAHIANTTEQNSVMVWAQGIAQVVFLLVPTLFIMRYSPLGVRQLLRLEGAVLPSQWVLGLLGVIAILFFSNGWQPLQEWLLPEQWIDAYRRTEMQIDDTFKSLLIARGGGWSIAIAFLVGAVIPAISEEVLFRGLVQRSLEESISPRNAILITGIVFGFLHFNPIVIVPLVLIGVYLGFLAWYTRSLALPIVAHFFNNAISVVLLNIQPYSSVAAEDALSLWQAGGYALGGLLLLVGIVQLLLRTPRVQLPVAHPSSGYAPEP